MTRASTPGSLSTSTAIVCRSTASTARALDQHHAFFRDRLCSLVLGTEQHLVMGGAGGDHREAVLDLIDDDIKHDSARRIDHPAYRIVHFVGPLNPPSDRAERIGQLDEIGQGLAVGLRIAPAM